MSLLIAVGLRSSIVLLVGLGLHALMRKRAAAIRHLVLAGAVGATAAVAPLSLLLPGWDVSVPALPLFSARAPAAQAVRMTVASAANGGRDQQAAKAHGASIERRAASLTTVPIAGVWFAGFLATAVMLGAGALRLRRIASRSTRVDDPRWLERSATISAGYRLRRRITVLQTDTHNLLATCGVFRPRVLLPSHAREWSDERIFVVLCHELAHIRRLDWLIQTAAEGARTVLWFNPLIWIACTRLRRESEQACDDMVLSRGVAARTYATHLLDLARECRRSSDTLLPAVPMARRSMLERRIADMLNPRLDRNAPSIRSLALPCALLLAVTVSFASIHAGQAGPAMLSGTVYDTTGGVIPGAAVTLEDATGMTYNTVSNNAGRFAFSNVQPGHYTLQASLPGFHSMRDEFDLSAPRGWNRAITLQVGNLRETVTVSAKRGTASPASAAVRPQPIRVGGNIRVPTKVFHVPPIYPESMQQAGLEGDVPIEAIIGRDGTVASVRVLSAEVHPDFAIAAADAVRQWRFTPTLLNGSPVEVVMTVSVTFTLSDQ